MEQFKWEQFEHGPIKKNDDRVYVTISPQGVIYFNRRAYQALGRPEYVSLFFDRSRSVLGVQRAPAGRAHAYKLKPKSFRTPENCSIHAAGFCRYFNIKLKETITFETPTMTDGGILLLSFREVAKTPKRVFKPTDRISSE